MAYSSYCMQMKQFIQMSARSSPIFFSSINFKFSSSNKGLGSSWIVSKSFAFGILQTIYCWAWLTILDDIFFKERSRELEPSDRSFSSHSMKE